MSGFGRSGFGVPADGHLGDVLSALLDGELAPSQARAAQVHLLGCPGCAAEYRAVGQARTWVRALPPVDPPFGFYERMYLDRAAVVVPVGTGLRRRVGLAAVGVAAAAVTVLGAGSPKQAPVVPSVPHFVQAHVANGPVRIDLVSKLSPSAVPVPHGH